jgi:hypothetical protein
MMYVLILLVSLGIGIMITHGVILARIYRMVLFLVKNYPVPVDKSTDKLK